MELTSKQRAQLRGIANTIDTIVHIGKDGINDNLVKQANDALEAREIIILACLSAHLPGSGGREEELGFPTGQETLTALGNGEGG